MRARIWARALALAMRAVWVRVQRGVAAVLVLMLALVLVMLKLRLPRRHGGCRRDNGEGCREEMRCSLDED